MIRSGGKHRWGHRAERPTKGRGGIACCGLSPFDFQGVNRGILTPILTPLGGILHFDRRNAQGSTPDRTCTFDFDSPFNAPIPIARASARAVGLDNEGGSGW